MAIAMKKYLSALSVSGRVFTLVVLVARARPTGLSVSRVTSQCQVSDSVSLNRNIF